MQHHKRRYSGKVINSIAHRGYSIDTEIKTHDSSTKFCQRCGRPTKIESGEIRKIVLQGYYDIVRLFFCNHCIKTDKSGMIKPLEDNP